MMGTEERANQTMLGMGVYSLAEVARYTRVHPNTVRNWFKDRSGRNGRGAVLRSDHRSVAGDYAVSFWDVIDAYVVGQLREAGVSMPTVRAAHKALRDELRTKHPFAHSDIYTDGRRVFRDASDALDDNCLLDVLTRQHFFPRVKELLSHVRYDDATKHARMWHIAPGVEIDPDRSYGKPVISGTGVTTFVLSRTYHANRDDAALVADLYQISEGDVRNAVRFEEQFGWRRAA